MIKFFSVQYGHNVSAADWLQGRLPPAMSTPADPGAAAQPITFHQNSPRPPVVPGNNYIYNTENYCSLWKPLAGDYFIDQDCPIQ